jgi:itaconate CoA-transferase
MRPLEGITVVALEHAIAAPFCTRQLADLGARVIKIERPGVGDFARAYDTRVHGQASHFVWTNRSKESLTLDLKHADAPGVLARLLKDADVLVQNLAPGAAARLGPYRDKKAYDLLIQSEAGFLSITGSPGEPAKAGCSIADIAAGMYAYSNILAALIQRGKTGRGCRLDISMLESMVEWMSYPMYYAFDGAPPPPLAGASHATIYPYGPFVAGDGKTVMLGLQNEREWQLFCAKVLMRPALAADERFGANAKRVANKPALQAIITEAFALLSAEQVTARLEDAQIANANVSTMADVWAHAQLRARERWVEVTTPAGPIPALRPPGMPASFDARMDAIPALGQHTDAILAELGFAPDRIRQMHGAAAV